MPITNVRQATDVLVMFCSKDLTEPEKKIVFISQRTSQMFLNKLKEIEAALPTQPYNENNKEPVKHYFTAIKILKHKINKKHGLI